MCRNPMRQIDDAYLRINAKHHALHTWNKIIGIPKSVTNVTKNGGSHAYSSSKQMD